MNRLAAILLAATTFVAAADSPEPNPNPGLFTFVRVKYDSEGGMNEAYYAYEGRIWERWETDFPEAEENFLWRLQQITTIAVNPTPISLRLTDEELLKYPFIYMSDVGWQVLQPDEEEALEKYLRGGGFLWVDDFWGNAELDNFEYNMSRVFPNLTWREIPKDHAIMNVVFPMEECPQIPAKVFAHPSRPDMTYDPPEAHRGNSWDPADVKEVHFKGLFDENNRLMAVMTHNSDIGDGWEREAEAEWYFQRFSVNAYAIGINIVVYAMTH